MTRSRAPRTRCRTAGDPGPGDAPARPRRAGDWLAWLDARPNFERRPAGAPGKPHAFGLAGMRRLLAAVGDPHRQIPVVHVAGTKGKGSTVAMIAAILRAAGLRVGSYLSPHVLRVEERICIDSRPIPAAELARSLAVIGPAAERLDALADRDGSPRPTWFEIMTAVAFDHFVRRSVDIAVIETGLGGRLDATNVCRPLVSVITPVSLDHTAILGPTVALIAGEKAGIVKRGRPVVCGARDPAARAVIEAVARKRRARLFLVDRDFTAAHLPPEAPAALGGGTLVYGAPAGARGGPRPPERYPLAMTGAHQADNAAMAVTAVRVLGDLGYTIPRRAVARGLAVARLPARIECVGRRPLVVVDAAHNAASMQALVESLGAAIAAIRASGAPAVLLFAASNDKAVEEMLAAVRGRFDRVILTQAARSLRATPTERLAAIAASQGLPVAGAIPDARAAFDRARALAGRDGLVCVAGSFFLAGDVLDRRDGAAEGLDDPRTAAGRSAAPRPGPAGGPRRPPGRSGQG